MDILGIPQELADRREAVASRLSPTARHQAFPRQYARPVPREVVAEDTAPLRQEIATLRAELAKVRREVEGLTALVSEIPTVSGRKAHVRPESVKTTFCECMSVFGISVGDEPWQVRHLEDAARGDAYAQPRMVCMWLVKRLCPDLSFPKVGHMFGGRDHTTVLHAMKRAPDILARRPDLRLVAMAVLKTYGSPWPEFAP